MPAFQAFCKQSRIDLPAKSDQSLAVIFRAIGLKSGKIRTAADKQLGVWRIDQSKIDTEEHYDEIEQPDPNSDY
jgi:hypothetical protein